MSKKRFQVVLSDEAWAAVEAVTNEASNNFKDGSINYSDVINEMILCAKIDAKALRLRQTVAWKVLRNLSDNRGIDFPTAMKELNDLYAKIGVKQRRTTKESPTSVEAPNG
jgi:hypothetical protein